MESFYISRELLEKYKNRSKWYLIGLIVLFGMTIFSVYWYFDQYPISTNYNVYQDPFRMVTYTSGGGSIDSLSDPDFEFYFSNSSEGSAYECVEFRFNITSHTKYDFLHNNSLLYFTFILDIKDIILPSFAFDVYLYPQQHIEDISISDFMSRGEYLYNYTYFPQSQKISIAVPFTEVNLPEDDNSYALAFVPKCGYGKIVLTSMSVVYRVDSFHFVAFFILIGAPLIGGMGFSYALYRNIKRTNLVD